jgi:biotin transport system substrate-specific component
MTTRDIAYIALFAALIAALGLFPPMTVPVAGVPITAQSLGAMLAGSVLGARRGALAVLLFLGLVAIGMPLLAGGRGGLGVFAGPTAGFLAGWVLGAFTVGWLVERAWTRLTWPLAALINAVGGILVVYAVGVPWAAVVTGAPLLKVLAGSAIYIPGDLIKVAVASLVAITVRRSYPLIRPARA